jgi:hypothetical protein
MLVNNKVPYQKQLGAFFPLIYGGHNSSNANISLAFCISLARHNSTNASRLSATACDMRGSPTSHLFITTAISTSFFYYYHPSSFTICTSTFSKLIEGG